MEKELNKCCCSIQNQSWPSWECIKRALPLQVVVPIWTLALYHAVAYAGSRFGTTRLWQQYGAKLQHILSAYQVGKPEDPHLRPLTLTLRAAPVKERLS